MPHDPHDPPQRKPLILGQVSPWRDPTHTILLSFALEGAPDPVVRVIVTNENPHLAGSRWQPWTEYWHATRSLPAGRRLVMSYSHASWTLDEVDRLCLDLPRSFSASQIAKGLWREERYSPPPDQTCYMFTAPDPDDEDGRLQIGLMLAFTADGLARVAWYKSSEPATGYVWHDASSPVKGLVWSPTESLDGLGWSFAEGR